MKIKKHIPNILSSSRLLSPFVLIPLILSGNLVASIVCLSGFFLTDALDGFLARKWHAQSELGAKIDAVADKTILASLLIPLIVMNPMMITTLIFEGLISIVNVVRKMKGGNPKTVQLGRIKMVIISLFVVFCYLTSLVSIPKFLFDMFFSITTLFQIGTLVKYIDGGIKEKNKILNDSKEKEESSIILENNNNLELEKTKEVSFDKLSELEKAKEELLKFKEEIINFNSENNLEKASDNDLIKVKKMSKNV